MINTYKDRPLHDSPAVTASWWRFFVILRFIFWTPWNSCSTSQSCRGCGEGYQVVSPPPSSSGGFLWASLFLGQRFSAFQDMMSGPSYSEEVRGFYWEGQTKPLICIGISEADAKTCLPPSWLNGRITSCACVGSELWVTAAPRWEFHFIHALLRKTSRPTVPNWSNKWSLYSFRQRGHCINRSFVLLLRNG